MAAGNRPHDLLVWVCLVALVAASLAAGVVLPKPAASFLIVLAAAAKALLVVLNYMHLKSERPLIYTMAVVPLILVIVLMLALFPDFVWRG